MVLSEAPLFRASPSEKPTLFEQLQRLHEQSAFAIGHVRCHFAALLTFETASAQVFSEILSKGVPREEVARTSISEVSKVLADLMSGGFRCGCDDLPVGRDREELCPEVFRHLVLAWEWNGFNVYEHPEDLVIYQMISTAAHSCDPNCESIVLYGLFRVEAAALDVTKSTALRKGDRFQQRCTGLGLRALRNIEPGEEITFSYCLEANDLAEDFMHRRRELNRRGWNFTCVCQRCADEMEEYKKQVRQQTRPDEEEMNECDGIDVLGLFEDVL
eukprot:TRINITY_DN30985_c0_g1_i1.p1 TRINITY_DN30985_c0_g1~~TRINITY_DN30985_c0_g1_i1.p1  ORF type:complete len:320 (+),score=33.95 TRINITY_DN30985_c0_g1_i1:144-962(+)